jgi:REP-associated tyrosine transposase
MARLVRIVVANVPHHVTQRGNARQVLLVSDEERTVYRHLLQKYVKLHQLRLLGYCLLSNHVHLVVIPHQGDALARALQQTHGRYASYWNATHGSSGHVWQGRFYSCPLDYAHLWIALRYTELNPVRAGLVAKAESWTWSSAGVHCGSAAGDSLLDLDTWNSRWSVGNWRQYLADGETEAEIATIRQCTHTGRPLGTPEFIHALEKTTHRHLVAQTGGRPSKAMDHPAQEVLTFDK